MNDKIPEEVELFLAQHIRSAEQLEVLLRVASQPERDWTPEAVYYEAKTNLVSITRHLQAFHECGLLQVPVNAPSAYRFGPQDPQLRKAVQLLASIYPSQMHRVIHLIYSQPCSG